MACYTMRHPRIAAKMGSAMAFDRTNSAAYLASQLAKGFARSLQRKAAGLGFSPGQFPILLELWQEEGLTQRQILDRLDVEQATLANTLSRMERDGLIERSPHPNDRRARIVSLTDRGRALQEEAMTAAAEAEDALLGGFRTFERHLLLEYMRNAVEKAQKL